jgi:hypothetical protein
MDWLQWGSGSKNKTIRLYQCAEGWQCEHTATEPPWNGAILLCRQCQLELDTGAQLVDQNGRPVSLHPPDEP